MRHHQQGNGLRLADAPYQLQHLITQGGIERREGLVQQQDRTVAQQAARQRRTLPLTAGELARQARQQIA